MSEEIPLHQPNDKLFKQTFSDPKTASGFLRAYLPASVVEAIDWGALKIEPTSFIDPNYQKFESDLVISVPIADRDGVIYCLVEHQTREDPNMALRLLQYMVCIWQNALKQSPQKPLPIILPLVLAQSDRKWKIKPNFASLFDLPDALKNDLQGFIPNFIFRLIQLAELPFDAIRGTPSGIMVMRIMKAERLGALLEDPIWDEKLMLQLPDTMLEILLKYLMNSEVDTDAIEGKMKEIRTPKLRTTAMTLAQKLHQEGRKEGRKEGQQEGLQKGRLLALQGIIIETLEIRFEQVPDELKEKIKSLDDDAKLHRLHRGAIRCANLEAFFEKL